MGPVPASARPDPTATRAREGMAMIACGLGETSVAWRGSSGVFAPLFDLPVHGAYDQAIRILGYGPQATGARSRALPGKRGIHADSSGSGAFSRYPLRLCGVARARSAQQRRQQAADSAVHRSSRTSRRSFRPLSCALSDLGIQVPAPVRRRPKPSHREAPDVRCSRQLSRGSANQVGVEPFVKGQTDTYVPFTLVVDRASLASGAAIWIRVVNVEQAAAFATALTTPPAKPQGNKTAPPVRTTFAWDNGSFVDVPEGGKLQRAIQLQARTVRGLHRGQGEDRRRAGRKPGEQSERTIATLPAGRRRSRKSRSPAT